MRFRSGRALGSGVGIAVVVTSVAVAAAPPASTGRQARRTGPANQNDPTRLALPRAGAARPVAASTERARTRLRSSLGRFAQVTVDSQTGGLKAVGKLDGYLTGASSAGAQSIALGYMRAHAAAFGLSSSDLDGLRLVRDYTSVDGVRHLQWAQVVDGITVVDSSLMANVTRDGRLVNVLGGARGGLKLDRSAPAVSADGAYTRALRSVGSSRAAPAKRSARSTGSRKTTYAGSGQAELVAYHAGPGLRLAWRVLSPVGRDGDYDTLVDATTGRIARRANLVKFADASVFDAAPGNHPGGTQVTRPIGQWLDPGATRLRGENAHAFKDVRDEVNTTLTEDDFEDTFTPPSDGDVAPSSGDDWLYPITSVVDATGNCPADPPGCTWNHTVPNSWQLNSNQATTQLFYFVNKFHDHLLAAPIGFDEASGNFEQVNQSGQGEGGDLVLAQSDDGADTNAGLPDGDHIDNANFDPRPDGIPGRMQMYLFQPLGAANPFSAVNGSDDPQIVYHEYTHGLSNRLIVDAQGFGAAAGPQAGAMGEAWSDWYALDFLARQGLQQDDPAPGDVREGEYVDGGNNLIRTEPTDCPPDTDEFNECPGFFETGPGGYTYQDFGLIAFGAPGGAKIPEVHADGEIWAQTLWQLRQRLVARYGQTGGSDRAERYITGGMRLGPPFPSFLDQRNAILQASTVAGGADTALIWDVFASRGMGYFASTKDDFDINPDADFSLPPSGSPTGIVRGVVRGDDGQPIENALVGLGGHDGPPGAGPALQDRTDKNGAYAITGIPQAEYPQLTVDAPAGYADTFTGAVTAGSVAVTRDVTVRRNHADWRTGGTITADSRNEEPWGCGWKNLIDGNENTVMSTASPTSEDNPVTPQVEVHPRTFTVTLPQPLDRAEVFIDPSAGCGLFMDSGLGAYTVQVSTNGSTFTTVAQGTFDRTAQYRLNRVPVKDMPDGVRTVRLIAESSLGDVSGLIGDLGFLTIADLQVYGRPNGASAPGGPGPGPGGSGPGGSGPGGPGTPPSGRAQLRPDLSKAKRKQRVKNKRTAYRVRCVRATPGNVPSTCRGTLTLAGSLGGKAMAKKSFSIKPGVYRTVRLTLKKRDLRRLRRHSVKTRLKAVVRNTGARSRRASRAVRIMKAKKGKTQA